MRLILNDAPEMVHRSTANPVYSAFGETLAHAIPVNELSGRGHEPNTKYKYVLIGVTGDGKDTFITRFVVNMETKRIDEIGVLHAPNIKRQKPLSRTGAGISPEATSAIISLAEVLEACNTFFADSLSESVLQHYGREERPFGDLSSSALFS